MDNIFKDKYLKYKNKYLKLQELLGGNNRRAHTCTRNHNCKNVLNKLNHIRSILYLNCSQMEFLERVPSKDEALDKEYKELLLNLEKFSNAMKAIGINIPEPNCNI
jgi:hypothetical protein